MKKKISNIFKYALLVCLFIPSVVYANENKYTVENFNLSDGNFSAQIKPGDYSKFYLTKYISNEEEIINEYNWDGEFTQYEGDVNELDYHYLPVTEYGHNSSYTYFPLNKTLMIAESETTPETYYSYTLNIDNKESVSSNIYSSSSKGESIGSFNNYSVSHYNYSKIYELAKIEGGYNYVTEAGDIILSDDNNGYKVVGNNADMVTFFNGTTIHVVKYVFEGSDVYKTILASTVKELLSKNDLTGLKLKFEFSIGETDYYSITLGNHTYFVDENFDNIIYETEVIQCDQVDYYAIEYDEKIYVFLDFNKYFEELVPYLEIETQYNYTIHTEVFDLDGNSLFGDTNWINIYYDSYGALFGITKKDDRYIMKFLTIDGEVMYSKDYTELYTEFNPYIVYGSLHLADHETNSIDTGKYILGYYYSDYLDEDKYSYEYKFLNVNEYYVLEGKNQTYDGKDLIIRFNGDFDKFENLLINDKIVSTDNYTKKSGSVIVTLKSDYLKSLEKGTYIVKAAFNGGGYANTSIVIPETVSNPKTGDSIILSIILGTISLICLIGIGLYTKKKSN